MHDGERGGTFLQSPDTVNASNTFNQKVNFLRFLRSRKLHFCKLMHHLFLSVFSSVSVRRVQAAS